jgi:hypothetical protein
MYGILNNFKELWRYKVWLLIFLIK